MKKLIKFVKELLEMSEEQQEEFVKAATNHDAMNQGGTIY